MKHQLTTTLIVLLAVTQTAFAQTNTAALTEQYSQQLTKQTTAVFEENKGQMKDQHWKARPDVLYYGKSEGMNYYIRNNGMSYQLSRVDSWKEEDDKLKTPITDKKEKRKVPDQIGTYRVDAEWQNHNSNFTVEKGKGLDGYNNYYNVPEGVEPALFVKQYETVTLKNLWNGIDVHYYSTNGFLETDYLVAPGADYKQIQIAIKGAELSTDKDGNLIMKTPFGDIREGKLKVYQNHELLEANWLLTPSPSGIAGEGLVSFEIPYYNPALALRIDPLTRVWGTYYGAWAGDIGGTCSTDGSNNIYLAGITNSTTTIASGGHQNTYVGGGLNSFGDAFLVKFNSNGVRQWGTYYGGSEDEYNNSCTTDGSGNVYLAGSTASTTAIASGGHQNTYGGGLDAFLVKFNTNGVRQWGTYYGGSGNDKGYSCATDGSGSVYLAGGTNSTTVIASGGHQNTYGGGVISNGFGDAFLVKFSTNGVRQWGTYYGGSSGDGGRSCATDGSGNVYLVGITQSTNAIATGGHQNVYGGGTLDAFLVKFNSNGVRQWGTYYGGSSVDEGQSCATDGSGNVYLAGTTQSTNAIATGGHQNNLGGVTDAFLVKFNTNGVREWGTYYGGSGSEEGLSLASDSSGNVYLAGISSSTTGIASGGYQNTLTGSISSGGDLDAILVKFNSGGIRQWGTYYGGKGYDGYNFSLQVSSPTCATDLSGNVYLGGYTISTSNIASGGHQILMVETQMHF